MNEKMFLPEKFPQKGITACTEKGMRGRLHSLFLLRGPRALRQVRFRMAFRRMLFLVVFRLVETSDYGCLVLK